MLVLILALAVVVMSGCNPTPATAAPTPTEPRLRRGLNAGNALDAPTEGAWGPKLDEAYFETVAAAGFDHVRLPVRFSAHAEAAAPFTIDPTFFARVDWAVNEAQKRGLTVIVDLHHYEELMASPDVEGPRFVGLWKQIAARYRGRPLTVVYELLNEPTKNLTAAKWNALYPQALAAVRAVDPSRKVIVDSVFWASAKELPNLVLPEGDPNVIGSFHSYTPMLFTHQGMPWMSAEYQTKGIVFPGPPPQPVTPVPGAVAVSWVDQWFKRYNSEPAAQNPGGPAALKEELDLAVAFAARTHRPVYLGELGAGDGADMASRVRWVRLMREEAERRGIGWAAWDDSGNMKVLDRATKRWETAILDALRK